MMWRNLVRHRMLSCVGWLILIVSDRA